MKLEPEFRIREPRKPIVQEYSPNSKARVKRNINESPCERLWASNKLTQEQYGILEKFEACHMAAYSEESNEIRERQDGGGFKSDNPNSVDAIQRLAKCAKMMHDYSSVSYTHLTLPTIYSV